MKNPKLSDKLVEKLADYMRRRGKGQADLEAVKQLKVKTNNYENGNSNGSYNSD